MCIFLDINTLLFSRNRKNRQSYSWKLVYYFSMVRCTIFFFWIYVLFYCIQI